MGSILRKFCRTIHFIKIFVCFWYCFWIILLFSYWFHNHTYAKLRSLHHQHRFATEKILGSSDTWKTKNILRGENGFLPFHMEVVQLRGAHPKFVNLGQRNRIYSDTHKRERRENRTNFGQFWYLKDKKYLEGRKCIFFLFIWSCVRGAHPKFANVGQRNRIYADTHMMKRGVSLFRE